MAFRRARIEVDVLYDDAISPAPEFLSSVELTQAGITDDYSLLTKDLSNSELTIAELEVACAKHGTDPRFFLGEER